MTFKNGSDSRARGRTLAMEKLWISVTPKKLTNSAKFCFLCKDNFSLPKSKINVLGKSALDIPSLILKATKEDVNVYVERERFYICRMKCYNRLVRYQNALQLTINQCKVGKEIFRNEKRCACLMD